MCSKFSGYNRAICSRTCSRVFKKYIYISALYIHIITRQSRWISATSEIFSRIARIFGYFGLYIMRGYSRSSCKKSLSPTKIRSRDFVTRSQNRDLGGAIFELGLRSAAAEKRSWNFSRYSISAALSLYTRSEHSISRGRISVARSWLVG